MGEAMNLIQEKFKQIMAESGLPEAISFNNEDVLQLEKTKKHYSLLFMRKLLFRIIIGENCYLELRPEYKDLIADINTETLSSNWLKLVISDIEHLNDYGNVIKDVFEFEFKKPQGDSIGCCSRYLECSDARKCTNPDFIYSLSCGYRINLLKGKIFYGANRNI